MENDELEDDGEEDGGVNGQARSSGFLPLQSHRQQCLTNEAKDLLRSADTHSPPADCSLTPIRMMKKKPLNDFGI